MSVVAVIGLGYTGLPLVIEFGKDSRTIGFDIDAHKVAACRRGTDPSREIADAEMAAARHAEYSDDPKVLAEADFIVVAVPTPVDEAHRPDFAPLVGASRSAGAHMKKGAVVVYESTVYPGATEEVCIPVLEAASGMKWQQDFFVGYSPERINPGDREHRLTNVVKVVAGDSPATLEKVAALYGRIVEPGVHRASSIKAAEACKVIENTQRDLNIALMNELAIIFDKIGIEVFVHDPVAGAEEAMHEYGVRLLAWDALPRADALVAAVAHKEFLGLGAEDFERKLVKGGCFVDVKALFDQAALEAAGLRVWRL